MQAEKTRSRWRRAAPALTLMLLAPLCAELLPGATRPSVYLGFPPIFLFELAVWGGMAVFVRFLVRRQQLGWPNLLLLGLAVAIAEEFLIQQTSIAPLVIKLKGIEYARAFGINYVYLLWALIYECLFVVLVPVALAELLFPQRRRESWLSTGGLIALIAFFVPGALGAWFSWTQYARSNVFHMPAYTPPAHLLLAGVLAIAVLMYLALGPARTVFMKQPRPMKPPAPPLLALLGALFATYVWGLAAVAFGVAPDLPPSVAVGVTVPVVAVALWLMRRWLAHSAWNDTHTFGLVAGTIIGNMAGGYLGYMGASPVDFWGKTLSNFIAVALLGWLASVVYRRNHQS